LLDDLLGLPGASSMHDRKVAAYLAKHFNVEDERRQLTRAISEARVLLDDPTTITPVDDSPTTIAAQPSAPLAVAPPPTEGARSSASAVGLGFLGGAAVAAVVALALWPHRREVTTPAPVAVPSTAAVEAKAPAAATVAPVEAQPPPVLAAVPEPAAPTAEMPTGSRTERRTVRVAPRRQLAPAVAAAPVAGDLLRDAARLFKAGAFDRAFAAARSAAQAGGGAPAHLIMGKVYFAKSDLPNAESEFRQVVALRPDDAEAARFLDVIRKQAHSGP
jgi:hypothetical protein